jgi:hypothetical protein
MWTELPRRARKLTAIGQPGHVEGGGVAKRAGKNPAKAAVARKILIAAWHVLARQQPFKPAAPRRPDPASASSRCFLAA